MRVVVGLESIFIISIINVLPTSLNIAVLVYL